MTASKKVCLAISDFNIQPFADCLRQNADEPLCEAIAAPFGQVTQTLTQIATGSGARNYDALMIWTQPEAVIPSYEALLRYESVPESIITAEVHAFARQVMDAAERVEHVFVANWSQPHFRRGLGIWSMRPEGCGRMLMKMNLELCDRLSWQSNVHVLNPNGWIVAAGPNSYNSKLWYLAKVPFAPGVFETAVRDFKAGLNAVAGRSKKLIIVDLDDTLWGGIVGEVGWENLRLGGHDAIGEAYADFQKALKALVRNGTILAVASKNEEAVALEAIDKHPEMILRRSDFAAWRINWSDKAQNIVDIAAQLNLDPSAIVYIDDSPAERNRVRSALPAVAVPDWPPDVFLFTRCLAEMPYFDRGAITTEDRQRTAMYVADAQRSETKKSFQSVQDWLQSLQMNVTVEGLSPANLPRAAQLFNKTNQMNLTTRRLAEADLWRWSMASGNRLFLFRVSDRFGDYGLTGMLGLSANGRAMNITDYILSCRVMGRGVEELMLAVAIDHARAVGQIEIKAEYIPSPKNAPCLVFFNTGSHFKCEGDHAFTWRVSDAYALPRYISVTEASAKTT